MARANAHAVAPPFMPEWRLGSLFEAVAGEPVELVVPKPPYLPAAG